MSQPIKTVILVILGLIIILFALALIMAPNPAAIPSQTNRESAASEAESAALDLPPVITAEAKYEVLSVVAAGRYRVKNLATGVEVDLAVPSDAIITGGQISAGSILQVNKSSILGNGVLAFDLSVVPK